MDAGNPNSFRLYTKPGLRASKKEIKYAKTNSAASVEPASGTRPEFTPLERHYRIDINTFPPAVKEEKWRLKIAGLVQQPLALTLEELRSYEPMHQFASSTIRLSRAGCGDLRSAVSFVTAHCESVLA